MESRIAWAPDQGELMRAGLPPVPECITMRALAPGEVDVRTGKTVTGEYANWTTHPNNPQRVSAAA